MSRGFVKTGANSPPRRGGVDAPSIKWIRSEVARPGWSFRRNVSGLKGSAGLTTPAAALRWLRIFFLMPQPPLLFKEGNSSQQRPVRHYPFRRIGYACVMMILAGITTSLPGQTSTEYNPPQNAYGQPDLSGIWQAMTTANWDIEEHGAAKAPYSN